MTVCGLVGVCPGTFPAGTACCIPSDIYLKKGLISMNSECKFCFYATMLIIDCIEGY